MRSADLIREARLRAGLSQQELGERSGRDRSVIARWEQAAVAPSVETLVDLVRACGFDLPLELVPYDRAGGVRLERNARLSPERRVARMLQARRKRAGAPGRFDPYALLAALERDRVAAIVIGAFARVIRGAEEVTGGIDVAVSLREPDLRRLERALQALGARRADGGDASVERLGEEPVLALETDRGELTIVPQPVGTREGYNDLRRAATREPIGKGLRPSVASVGDLARMLAALGRGEDVRKLRELRRLAELERGLGLEP